MKLIAIMPVRNEEWILGLSLRVALKWCDEVVILNHASSDRTQEIIANVSHEAPGRVHVNFEPDGTWREMEHRQRLLDVARRCGATHIAPIDADEILTSNMLGHVRSHAKKLLAGTWLEYKMFMMWRSPWRYRDDSSIWSNRSTSILFADAPALGWSAIDGYDHHHREPHGARVGYTMRAMNGGVMHMQFSDWRRLTAKHALYKMTERIRWPHKQVGVIESMYNLAMDERGLRVSAAPVFWWSGYEDLLKHLHIGAEPWQEAECARLLREHGTEKFAGLNLFGVVDQCAPACSEIA